MISKARIKFITSLRNKKTREEEKLFVIEGDKLVKEFLGAGIPIKMVLGKPEFLNSIQSDLAGHVEIIEKVSYDELKQISTLKTPHNALAVVHMDRKSTRLNSSH